MMLKMYKLLLLLCLFTIANINVAAQTGKVYDELSMTSKILDGERKYAIYLPPDYESSSRSYPVLYLLMVQVMTRLVGYNLGKYCTSQINAIEKEKVHR